MLQRMLDPFTPQQGQGAPGGDCLQRHECRLVIRKPLSPRYAQHQVFCILTPCSLIVIQLCQAALSAFQLSFTAQGCVLQGTGQAVSTVAGRHRCGFDSD